MLGDALHPQGIEEDSPNSDQISQSTRQESKGQLASCKGPVWENKVGCSGFRRLDMNPSNARSRAPPLRVVLGAPANSEEVKFRP